MFVRYISHEVRTPLNTAVLGLQYLERELAGVTLSAEVAEALTASKVSCDTAVTVLNEFLAFDKLEGGTLIVEKTHLNAWTLIQQTAEPFFQQVTPIPTYSRFS